MRRLAVAIGVGAMLATPVPAAAQERGERRAEHGEQRRDGDRRDHRRRHRGDDAIELSDTASGVLVGALVIGGLAALFAGKKKPPVAPEPAVAFAADADPERVASACAVATEAEGRRSFAVAQVGAVREVRPEAGGFAVAGDVVLRTGWRDEGERRGFRCLVDPEAVRSVSIDGFDQVAAVGN